MKIFFVDAVLGHNNIKLQYIRHINADQSLIVREDPSELRPPCFFLSVKRD